MKVQVIAVTMLLGAGAHAASLDIPAGTIADCIPSPSIEAIKSASIFQGDKPALVQMMTCDVMTGQPIPAQSRLLGEVRAVSALGPYSIVWRRLQLRSDQGDLVWSPNDEDFASSLFQGNGQIRVTFKRGLNVHTVTATSSTR